MSARYRITDRGAGRRILNRVLPAGEEIELEAETAKQMLEQGLVTKIGGKIPLKPKKQEE